MIILEAIYALVLTLILTLIIGFPAYYGFENCWKIIGRITKLLTPLFNYYTKLRIREYTLYFIIESIIAYILVTIPFVLFALLGAHVIDIIINLFNIDLFWFD